MDFSRPNITALNRGSTGWVALTLTLIERLAAWQSQTKQQKVALAWVVREATEQYLALGDTVLGGSGSPGFHARNRKLIP